MVSRFRWVELQLKFLYGIRIQSHLVERLGKLPPDLEKSYQELYDHQMQHLGGQSEVTRQILSWLLISKRPLTVAETCELVCASDKHSISPEIVLELCFDLVTLDRELDRFRFAHLSVREFLEKRDEYSQARTHGMATNACLQLMTKYKRFSPPGYDAVYWPFHAEDAVRHSGYDMVKENLDTFLTWESSSSMWSSGLRQDSAAKHWDDRTPAERRIFKCLKNTYTHKSASMLLIAACFGLTEQLKRLITVLSQSSDREIDDLRGFALCLSCEYGQTPDATILADHGADVNSRDNDGWSPLSLAAVSGHTAIVEMLLKQGGVDVYSRAANWGRSPLSWAAANGHTATVELLLTHGVDSDPCDNNGRSPLSWAARSGHTATVELLLKQGGVDVDSRDKKGLSSLSWAAVNGHTAIVELLLKQGGVDLDSRDNDGRSPLSWAAVNGHTAIVELLLKHGADVQAQGGYYGNALYAASLGSHIDVVRLLLDEGADVNAEGGWCCNALFAASTRDDNDIVALLLEKGFRYEDIEQDLLGRSRMMLAACYGYLPGLEQDLTDQNAINAIDNHQWTALHWAAYFDQVEAIDLLLRHGASNAMVDWQDWTARDVALFAGHERVSRRLEQSTDQSRSVVAGHPRGGHCDSCGHVSQLKQQDCILIGG
jgi:ankyrin repeat protein